MRVHFPRQKNYNIQSIIQLGLLTVHTYVLCMLSGKQFHFIFANSLLLYYCALFSKWLMKNVSLSVGDTISLQLVYLRLKSTHKITAYGYLCFCTVFLNVWNTKECRFFVNSTLLFFFLEICMSNIPTYNREFNRTNINIWMLLICITMHITIK